jgi:hypothetical protein
MGFSQVQSNDTKNYHEQTSQLLPVIGLLEYNYTQARDNRGSQSCPNLRPRQKKYDVSKNTETLIAGRQDPDCSYRIGNANI